MKKLIFVRHAKSSWKDSSLGDLERPLKSRGEKDIELQADILAEIQLIPEMIVSSHALRALQTAKGFAAHLGLSPEQLEEKERLYHAFYHDVQDIINDLDDEMDVVMIIGHNPTATNFANKFSKDYIANVPTCGMLVLESKVNTWSEFSRYNTDLVHFSYPKMLRD
jgi:phosphohistidine phosphatase